MARKLNIHIRNRKCAVKEWLQEIRNQEMTSEVTLAGLAKFLTKVFYNNRPEDIQTLAEEIDIDQDNIISEEDVIAFLQRYHYFDEKNHIITRNYQFFNNQPLQHVEKSIINSKSIDLMTIGSKNMFKSLAQTQLELNQKTLFPKQEIDEDRYDRILKDLRKQLLLKGIKIKDFFKMLDSDQDGFITITEMQLNIQKVLELSKEAVDCLFKFMDKQTVGLIPYSVFAKCMNKSIVNKTSEGPEDNFDWEYEILFKIRNWVHKENLTVEEAFRAIDKDFDGFISKTDIQNYLKEVLKFEDKEIT